MKIYLSGPMRGYKDFNFPAFDAAATDLRSRGHIVYNPPDVDREFYGDTFKSEKGSHEDLNNGFDIREALARDLAWVCKEAEAIALLEGWGQSKGAKAEYHTAVALGLKIIEATEFGWKVRIPRMRNGSPHRL